jgi:hypothetical protein
MKTFGDLKRAVEELNKDCAKELGLESPHPANGIASLVVPDVATAALRKSDDFYRGIVRRKKDDHPSALAKERSASMRMEMVLLACSPKVDPIAMRV